MKKKVRKLLGILIVGILVMFLCINYFSQIIISQNDMTNSSKVIFRQIDQIIKQNEEELEKRKEDIRNICILRARATAYLLQQDKSKVNNLEEMKKIANLLEVDEIHIFNKEGTIYAGTEPKYYGLNMKSGEQISFFSPMLEDTSMSMCQEITANTAENKMMQYAATWTEDGDVIVQIGMKPSSVLEKIEKNKVSYIFSRLAETNGYTLVAIEPETNKIVGSTKEALVNKNISDIGINTKKMKNWDKAYHFRIKGKWYFCIFEKQDTIIVGRICEAKSLYSNINENNFMFFIYILLIGGVVIYFITHYLDKNIIKSISAINNGLQDISNGNLDTKIEVNNTPEFKELSHYINQMVESILETTDKISVIIDTVGLPIGLYEYNGSMERVRITHKLPEVMGLSEEEAYKLCENREEFNAWISEILSNTIEGEHEIYKISSSPDRYVKIEIIKRDDSVFGIVVDKTSDICTKNKLEKELGEDELTGLCSRRGFYSKMDELFALPEKLGCAAVVMIDSDDLKKVNDTYGHNNGDRYLCEIANILLKVNAPGQLTARLGGDEFAILFYGAGSKEEIDEYMNKLEELRMNHIMKIENDVVIDVKFSMGKAFYIVDGVESERLMRVADKRMYIDKRERKKKQME